LAIPHLLCTQCCRDTQQTPHCFPNRKPLLLRHNNSGVMAFTFKQFSVETVEICDIVCHKDALLVNRAEKLLGIVGTFIFISPLVVTSTPAVREPKPAPPSPHLRQVKPKRHSSRRRSFFKRFAERRFFLEITVNFVFV
jgi:hypothetical protein